MTFIPTYWIQNAPLDAMALDDLLRRCRAGDRDAFNTLVGHYHGRTYRLAFRMLGDRDAAADATQEIFLKAWRKISGFRGAASFTTWLHTIAVRHCLDVARRQAREALRTEALPLEDEGASRRRAARPSSRDLEASDWELSLEIQNALRRLPEEQQTVVILHYYGSYSVTEIAEALRTPDRTVRYRLRAALQRLQRFLGPVDLKEEDR